MDNIKLTIKNNDGSFNFEHTISLLDAGFIISHLGGAKETKIVKEQKKESKPQTSVNDTKDLINTLERYQPKSNVEKFTVFADYLNKTKNEEPFSEDELKKLFEVSNQKMPENFKRDLGICVDRGLIFKLKDSDLYITTAKTAKELENMVYKQSIDESTIFKKKRVRGQTERAELNNTVKTIPITGSIKNVNIKYKDLKSGSDRILWILLYLKTYNIDASSIKDIEFISVKLGKELKSKYFAMYNKENVEDGKVAKVENKFSILEEGENYISSLSL